MASSSQPTQVVPTSCPEPSQEVATLVEEPLPLVEEPLPDAFDVDPKGKSCVQFDTEALKRFEGIRGMSEEHPKPVGSENFRKRPNYDGSRRRFFKIQQTRVSHLASLLNDVNFNHDMGIRLRGSPEQKTIQGMLRMALAQLEYNECLARTNADVTGGYVSSSSNKPGC